MTYFTLETLGNNTLKLNDIVYFHTNSKQLKYSVQSNHLSNMISCNNEEIFSILGMEKGDFCNSYYGYYNYGGDWPTCRTGDYAALTRVVKALYREIEHKKTREANTLYLENKNLIQELKTKLNTTPVYSLFSIPEVPEKKENTSSNIITKRKSKIKRIIGEESIKLNNY